MPTAPDTPRTRKTAGERREEIVRIAIQQFALGGYNGTSTETIARDAGISQPYLFRLFKTKRELFLACYDAQHERLRHVFSTAGEGLPPDEVLPALGAAYVDLLGDRHALLFQMQSYAACADPVIQAHVRERFGALVKLVARVSDAPSADVWQFFSHGMLLNVIASLDLPAIAEREAWAEEWCTPGGLIQASRGSAAG
jgi:AcrR family transcriptional regulator